MGGGQIVTCTGDFFNLSAALLLCVELYTVREQTLP